MSEVFKKEDFLMARIDRRMTEFDRGFLQALNQVMAEHKCRCHRAVKDCKKCKADGIQCNTYDSVERVFHHISIF